MANVKELNGSDKPIFMKIDFKILNIRYLEMKETKILKLTCLFALIVLFFSSCKPKIELTSDYKDVTVVYGLLNPLDEQHYIKIYKGYLTKDNALVWARDLDNISYYDDITVKLEEYKPESYGGSLNYTYPLDTAMSIEKNSGTFAYPTQVLYRVRESGSHRIYGHEGFRYRLVIENKKNGSVVTAETRTIPEPSFDVPGPYFGTSVSSFMWYKDDPWYVGCKTLPENAYAVDAYLTFRYIEKNKATGDTVHKSIDNIRLTTGFVLGKEASFKPSSILRIIHDHLNPDDNVWRYADDDGSNKTRNCIDIKLWVCDQVYYTFYKTAQPSSSIVQDRVEYTNIEAADDMALGFFASRTYKTRRFSIYNLSDWKRNEDSLVYGQWTKNLGFRPYDELE